MAAASAVLKRFKFDQEELMKSPVSNVSAVPLENDMFEWHCNIRQDQIIFHLILFFPKEYPYKSPSAEFVPVGFQYNSGATKQGKKGTQICLDIFSDFSTYHTEWKTTKGNGWSPAYTVQTILMNVVAFLAETQAGSSQAYNHNLELCKKFTCSDCGHSYKAPFPALDDENTKDAGASKGGAKASSKKGKAKGTDSAATEDEDDTPQLIDYISKEKFSVQKPTSVDDLWGYGLAVSGTNWRPTLTSPCEFITGRSFFGMQKAFGTVQSVFKEELKLFLPLHIHPTHGSGIKEQFEKTMREVGKLMPKYNEKSPIEDLVLKTIPNLLTSTVVEFSKGTQHTSDNSLNGYFALHRLFLWAIDTYPKLQDEIEKQIKDYVDNEEKRSKDEVPYIAEWLMLVAGSKKYRWKDVASAYLSESWKRSVIWYVKDDEKLGYLDTPKEYRIKHTYDLTEVARKHLAFQASFLNTAMPSGMSREAIIKRYDENFGFPTKEMVQFMKSTFTNINTNMKNYQDWFQILQLPEPTDDELYSIMVEAVRFSIVTKGYYWSNAKSGGGWGKVFDKYKDMREQHSKTDKKKADSSKNSAADKPEASASESVKDNGGSKKGSKATRAPRMSIAAAPRMSIAAAPRMSIATAPRMSIAAAPRMSIAAAPRGRKRKADSDDNDSDSAKPASRGRGRGKKRKC